jgi:hypothetical protein
MVVDGLAYSFKVAAANLGPPTKETTNYTDPLDRSYHKQECGRFVERQVNVERLRGL